MLNRMSRLLLVVPMVLSVASPAFAAGGIAKHVRRTTPSSSVLPLWQLEVNGTTKIAAKMGEYVTFRLSGPDLARASAVLSIRKFGGTLQTLPFMSGKINQPFELKVLIPVTKDGIKSHQEHSFNKHLYTVQVIGRTRDGRSVQSNPVFVYAR